MSPAPGRSRSLTLVEVGECFVMQLDGRRGSCTQNILEGQDLVFIVRGQVGLFLLEDGQGEHVAETTKHKENSIKRFYLFTNSFLLVLTYLLVIC